MKKPYTVNDMLERIASWKLMSFWPLLVIILILGAWVYQVSPQNLKLVPYKLLIVCLGAYVSHRIDLRFFKDKSDNVAEAIVYAATVLAMALAL